MGKGEEVALASELEPIDAPAYEKDKRSAAHYLPDNCRRGLELELA